MWFRSRLSLGLGLLLLGGCQLVAGLEARSELVPSEEQGGEGGSEARGGAGQGGAETAGAGQGGSSGGSGQAGEGGVGGSTPDLARPPPRVGDPVPSNSKDPRVFIVRKLDVGFRDSNGDIFPPEKKGKSIGFDFDGKYTVSGDITTRSCKSEFSPILSSYGGFDGEGGLDNLFGGTVFPALGMVKPSFDQDLNFNIESDGASTLLFEIEDLDDGLDDAYAPANLYIVAQLEKKVPKWEPPDPRVLDITSVDVVNENGDPCPVEFGSNPSALPPAGCKAVAKIRFPDGYVANNTWVSGPFDPGKGIVHSGKSSLVLGGIKLEAELSAVLVTLQFANDKHEKVTKGTYGAVISAEALKGALPNFLDKVCIPTSFAGTDIVDLIVSSSDIMDKPPFSASPDTKCNALTIGLGLTVVPGKIGGTDVGGKFVPYLGKSLSVNPCTGGAGGAAGGGGSAGSGGGAAGGGGSAGSSGGAAGGGGSAGSGG